MHLLGNRRGFYFIRLALKEAFSNRVLLKPALTLLFGALLLLLIFLVPLNMVIFFLDRDPLALALIGFLCAVLLYVMFVWADVSCLASAAIFDDLQTQTQPDPTSARLARKSGWREVLRFDLAYPSLSLRARSGSKPRKVLSGVEGSADPKAWLKGLYLVKPLIALERLKLKDVPARIHDMVSRNLLRFDPALVRVRRITFWLSLLFIILGIAAGTLVAILLTPEGIKPVTQIMLAGSLGLVAGGLVTLPGAALNAYARMIYHTAIYRWVINVDQAGASQTAAQIPDILAQTLNRQFQGQ